MKKYRKKPIVIEAVEWKGNNFEDLIDLDEKQIIVSNPDGTLTIPTLEGNHLCKKGDFIIKGIKGELYPCKPDIFEQTYEEALGWKRYARSAESIGIWIMNLRKMGIVFSVWRLWENDWLKNNYRY